MEAFARLVIRFRWQILAIWLIVVAVLVVTAPFGPAFSEHGNTNPLPSSAPSLQAQQLLAKHFRATQPQAATFTDYVILVDPHGIRSDDEAAAVQIGSDLRGGLSSTGLVDIGSPLHSQDGKALMLVLTWDGTVAGSGQDGHRQAAAIIERVHLPAGATAGYASGSVANDDINRGIDERLPISLALAVVAVILVLAVIFRSVLGVIAPFFRAGHHLLGAKNYREIMCRRSLHTMA